MTDKERIHRWLTQADLERMLDDAYQCGIKVAHQHMINRLSGLENERSAAILAITAQGNEASDKLLVEHDCLREAVDMCSNVVFSADKR